MNFLKQNINKTAKIFLKPERRNNRSRRKKEKEGTIGVGEIQIFFKYERGTHTPEIRKYKTRKEGQKKKKKSKTGSLSDLEVDIKKMAEVATGISWGIKKLIMKWSGPKMENSNSQSDRYTKVFRKVIRQSTKKLYIF